MEPLKYIDEIREAYERTLKVAADTGAKDFRCGYLPCDHCPFITSNGTCGNTIDAQRTVAEWQQWWYELTGERDTRSVEQILKDSTVTEEECAVDDTLPTAEHTAEPAGEDTLQPTVPTVDIIWTTATGNVKHRAGPIALLDGEMRQFSREVGVWISEMSKPDTCNSLADSIMFVARDETGAVLANVSIDASLFGKQKVWKSTER